MASKREIKINKSCLETLRSIKKENPKLEETVSKIIKMWWFLTEDEKKAIVYWHNFRNSLEGTRLTQDFGIGMINISQFVEQADKINENENC